MKRDLAVSIIIPTYNEKENLKILLPKLLDLYPSFHIFVIDDHSSDHTSEYLNNLQKSYPHIHWIERRKKMGRGSAVLEGLEKASKDTQSLYFLEMDADISHNPDDIKNILTYADDRSIVIGSRYTESSRIINWPLHRSILSIFANWYIGLFLGIPIHDYTNGFRLYPKVAVELLLKQTPQEQGYAVLSETAYFLYKNGFSFIEVPTTFVNRKIGSTKTDGKEFVKSLIAIPLIRLRYRQNLNIRRKRLAINHKK